MATKCRPKSVEKKTPAYRLAKPTTLIPGDVIQSTINGWRGRLRVTAVIPHLGGRPLVTVKTYDDESHREIWLTVRAASRLRVVLTNPGGTGVISPGRYPSKRYRKKIPNKVKRGHPS